MEKRTAKQVFRAITVLFFTFFYFGAGAQTLENTLATYAGTYAQERAYLHYDKSVYTAGETVWFKAYLIEGILPVQGSKTLYIDWVDDKGSLLMHSVSPIVDAVTNGQFDIPSDYAGSVIHVRAYTKWMLNFDSSFLYHKDLRVVGKAPGSLQKTAAATTSLQFFAEGGDAVAGIKNKIAFKAANQWGTPVAVTGAVQSSDGKTVASFATQHDGMGFFYLEPQPGMRYTALWKDAKGAAHTTELPAIKSNGIALELTVDDTKRRFIVTRTSDVPDALKQVHLVGTMNQTFVFKSTLDLSGRSTNGGIIPTEALPSGILTVTLFDAAWNAIAERITFINNNDYRFEPQLTVEHWGLNKRARNEIQIAIPDSIEAYLSVAVTDNAIAADSSDNIINRLLLTSEIKGYVANPEYYFSASNDSAHQYLDLVMLTNGWRRFKWEDVVKGKLPLIRYPKDTTYLSISGRLYGMPQGSINNGSINMIIKAKDSASSKMMLEPINRDGSFYNPEALFFDTLHVYYQLQPAALFKDADVRFMESRLPPPDYKQAVKNFNRFAPYGDTAGNYRFGLLAQERERVSILMKQKMLENVTVRSKTKTPVQVLDEKYASGLFRGIDSYQFDLVNDPLARSYTNIFNYLQGKVAGLQISGAGSNTTLQWRGGKPAVFLDEMNTDVDMLSSISVSDIAYVKVFRPPFMGSFNGSSGAIAIYTRKGNDTPQPRSNGLKSSTISGYTPIKEFYTPNYASINPQNEQRDLRTTLYWNPDVHLTPRGRTVTLTFYNNDITNAFRVIVEGMTSDGRLTHIEQTME